MELDRVSKSLGVVTAAIAILTGSWTLSDRMGIFRKPVLTWAPEYFSVSDGSATGEFRVIVAREKHRDDCSVERFKLEVRDSQYQVHEARSSVAIFSGPATNKVDRFGYTITIVNPERVAVGPAVLLANIGYKCPEGSVVINYPDHKNLGFNISS